MAIYKIKDDLGNTINTIVADESYVEAMYPNHWELVTEPVTKEINWKITRLAFLNRFTDQEAIDIDLLSQYNPNYTQQQNEQAASIRRYMNKVNAAFYIDLSRPDTQAGVRAFETAHILAAGRADEILLTEPTTVELYNG